MNHLSLGSGHRKGEVFKNGAFKTGRKYVDFIVSGQSLGELFGLSKIDLVGVFGWTTNKQEEERQLKVFLGYVEPELESGRTCFYVCGECGDIGCGAITAQIEITATEVTWKDFGYQSNNSIPHLEDYREVGPFTFDRVAYTQVLKTIRNRKY